MSRDPLPLIRQLYRQHASRPEMTAAFLADQAADAWLARRIRRAAPDG